MTEAIDGGGPTASPPSRTSEVPADRRRPLHPLWPIMSWVLATVLFVLLVAAMSDGVPTQGDELESEVPLVLVSHGTWTCLYGYLAGQGEVAPLYPLLAGGTGALFHLTAAVPVRDVTATAQCPARVAALNVRLERTGHLLFRWLALIGWLGLLAGYVLVVRAAGKGRGLLECGGLVILACSTPVLETTGQTLHPEGLLALGLGLASLAAVLRQRWLWAGVLLGLGLMAQQFDLLFAVPLFFLLAGRVRARLVAACVAAVAAVVVPLWLLSSTAVFDQLAGRGLTLQESGAVEVLFHLKGAALVVVARGVPLALAALLAWVMRRRLGDACRDPVPLLAVMAASMALRMVFESAVFGYYYAGSLVLLVTLDACRGRFRVGLFLWIVAAFLLYPPTPLVSPITSHVPVLSQLALALVALAFALVPLARVVTTPGAGGTVVQPEIVGA
jgi:hypothetical protein